MEETLAWINEQTYRSTRTKVPRAQKLLKLHDMQEEKKNSERMHL